MYRVASLFFFSFHRRIFFCFTFSFSPPFPTHMHIYAKRISAFLVVTILITVSFPIISLPLKRRTETEEKVLPSVALFLFFSSLSNILLLLLLVVVVMFYAILMMTAVTTAPVVVMILLVVLPRAYKQQEYFFWGK
jgi:hypothetical protein